jgi:hypothetical protein
MLVERVAPGSSGLSTRAQQHKFVIACAAHRPIGHELYAYTLVGIPLERVERVELEPVSSDFPYLFFCGKKSMSQRPR